MRGEDLLMWTKENCIKAARPLFVYFTLMLFYIYIYLTFSKLFKKNISIPI